MRTSASAENTCHVSQTTKNFRTGSHTNATANTEDELVNNNANNNAKWKPNTQPKINPVTPVLPMPRDNA